jgi:hypothetical protein
MEASVKTALASRGWRSSASILELDDRRKTNCLEGIGERHLAQGCALVRGVQILHTQDGRGDGEIVAGRDQGSRTGVGANTS